jgi:hypothetical protein
MRKTRKERREAAAKAARSVKPVAVAVSTEDKLRVAYSHVEALENLLDDQALAHSEYIMAQNDEANRLIDAAKARTLKVGAACYVVGLLGGLLCYMPW